MFSFFYFFKAFLPWHEKFWLPFWFFETEGLMHLFQERVVLVTNFWKQNIKNFMINEYHPKS